MLHNGSHERLFQRSLPESLPINTDEREKAINVIHSLFSLITYGDLDTLTESGTRGIVALPGNIEPYVGSGFNESQILIVVKPRGQEVNDAANIDDSMLWQIIGYQFAVTKFPDAEPLLLDYSQPDSSDDPWQMVEDRVRFLLVSNFTLESLLPKDKTAPTA